MVVPGCSQGLRVLIMINIGYEAGGVYDAMQGKGELAVLKEV